MEHAPVEQKPIFLLVDVGDPHREALTRRAASSGLEVVLESGELALHPSRRVALGVLEIRSEEHAVQRAHVLRKLLMGSPVVVLGHHLSTNAVVKLVRSGVCDVVELPADPELVVVRTLEHARLGRVNRYSLAGESPVMQRLRKTLSSVAASDSTVLITGETGSGKSLAARIIHEQSPHAAGRFVRVDCPSISAAAESELFANRVPLDPPSSTSTGGCFELARNGTLLLDGIDELALSLQNRLVHELEGWESASNGSQGARRARVVATSSEDLALAVEEGRFRPALYFRLGVVHIEIPPLRERLADIPTLVRVGLDRLAERYAMGVPAVSDGFYQRLIERDWPGNVRELMNVLERVLIKKPTGMLDADDLNWLGSDPASVSPSVPTGEAQETRAPRASDQESLARTLRETGGNISRAARRLGLARSTLRYRIRAYELEHLVPRD